MTNTAPRTVEDLVRVMTLEEKIAQLGSCWIFELLDTNNNLVPEKLDAMLSKGIGQITRISGASTLDPRGVAEAANAIQSYLANETRLGIPALLHDECLDGFMAAEATSFPQAIGMAASFDPSLPKEAATITARQMRAAGTHQGLAPVLDIGRDPRWGRIEETYGEDPHLVAAMASAYIRGLQGDGDLGAGVIATAKHFVAHGVPEGGMNAAPPHIGPRELREVHLRPYEAAVREANVQSFMHAYHEIDAVPCAANSWLLQDVLRDELGFDGTVVSDYNGIEELVLSHAIADDYDQAAIMALEGGIDVELPSTAAYGPRLTELVASGRLDEGLIDRAVTRTLRQKLELGLFDHAEVDPEDPARRHDAFDREAAVRIAARSVVLTHHRNDVLPLSRSSHIAVVGPSADDPRNLLADYAYETHIEALVEFSKAEDNPLHAMVPEGMEAPLDQIETFLGSMRRLAPDATITHAAGGSLQHATDEEIDEAVAIAAAADVAVVVVGERSGLTDDCTCGEARDRLDITLLGRQGELIERVASTGTPTVVLVIGGRPLHLDPYVDLVDAIMIGWLPGADGAEGLSSVLLGDVTPGGKLPVTFPRGVGQVPSYYRHHPSGGRSRWKVTYADGDNTPLWAFGHGLSYTTFSIHDVDVATPQVEATDTVVVTCRVTNTGKRSGDEVVQLYVTDDRASVTRPIRQLEGFVRIGLEPGETRGVRFEVPVTQLAFFDRDMRRVVEPGSMTVAVGSASDRLEPVQSFEITGPTTEVLAPPVCGTTVTVERTAST